MIITPSCKLYLPFEGNALDASGNGNNGTVYGAVLATGKFGQGYSFDGVNDYIDCGNNISLQFAGGQSFTIAAWVKFLSYPRPHNPILTRSGPNGTFGYTLGVNNTGVPVWYTSANGTVWKKPSVIDTLGTTSWRFIAAWFDYAKQVSGVQVDCGTIFTVAQTGIFATSHPVLLAKHVDPVTFAHTYLDEVMIFNHALSQSDIKRIYLGMHPLGG